MSTSPSFDSAPTSRPVAIWLFAVAALVFLMILVGGATRLTDSGLSITEWKPVTGAIPPLNHAQWLDAFAKYQASGEYKLQNAGMSLAQFQFIYFWEWGHRLLGRLIGLAFALPLVVFWLQKRIPNALKPRLVVLLALGGLQGLVGWWMVASGLVDRVDVLPERLAAHLGLALILFGALIVTALDCLRGRITRPVSPWLLGFLALVFTQILLGALVAGNDAGRIYTDWPTMGGALIPHTYWDPARDLWGNLFHNPAMVQFHHRLGGYAVFIAVLVMRLRMGPSVRALYMVAITQVALGVITLMSTAPLPLSLVHQALAVVLFAKTVTFLHKRHR